MKRAGVALTLAFVPALTAVGFLLVGLASSKRPRSISAHA